MTRKEEDDLVSVLEEEGRRVVVVGEELTA
jgi:hypothetical protein